MYELITKIFLNMRKAANDPKMFKKITSMSILVFVLSTVAGLCLDFFLPFNMWMSFPRAILSAGIAVSIFVVSWMVAYTASVARKLADEDYETFRERLPRRTRINIAIIGGALAVGGIIAVSGQSIFYTFGSGVWLSLGLFCVMFVRMTPEESVNAELGLPDYRELKISAKMKKVVKEKGDDE